MDDESAPHGALDHSNAGPPLSPWLTGADGWREARFHFVVWRPCRETGPGVPTLAGLTPEQYRSALAPENLELLRRTTWGHEGRRLDETHRKARSVEWEFLSEFCPTLLEGSR